VESEELISDSQPAYPPAGFSCFRGKPPSHSDRSNAKGFEMFGTKSGLRTIATIAATAAFIGVLSIAPAKASNRFASTDTFLKNSFVSGQFIDGFTPGKPDFGFTLEAMLQRKALGESKAELAPAVSYSLTNPTITGTEANPTGYLFDSSKRVKLGIAGKFAFTSVVLNAPNQNLRRAITNDILSKIDGTGDIAANMSANTFDRAWVVLALQANGFSRQATNLAVHIISHQLADGGFNDGYDLGVGSPDGTGIVLQALAAVRPGTNGQLRAIKQSEAKAVAYLTKTAVNGDHYEAYGDYSVNSTAYAAMGLAAAGKKSSAVKSWLIGKLASDGGLQTSWSGGAGDEYATAQSGLALLGQSYLNLIK
jgi:hypothetical protein